MNQQMIDECLKTNYNVTLDTSFLGEDKNHTLRIRRLEIKKTNNFP
jgi:formyltetrahydrofolate synthetase